MHDSSRTSDRIRPSLKPSVFRTPSSLVRSRIDCAIVLPATKQDDEHDDGGDRDHDRPMSPICLAKSATNAFSVAVLVSAGEFANIASIALGELVRRRGSATLDHVPADLVAEAGRGAHRLVQVVVVEEELRLVDAAAGES